jgi:hypothetical protein
VSSGPLRLCLGPFAVDTPERTDRRRQLDHLLIWAQDNVLDVVQWWSAPSGFPALPVLWRDKELADHLQVPPATLNTWRRRGLVLAQRGRRWVYWANEAELARLNQLRRHPRVALTPVRAYPRSHSRCARMCGHSMRVDDKAPSRESSG